MLKAKKVEEARKNCTHYLSDGMIKKSEFIKIVYDTYMRNHKESLACAQQLFDTGTSHLWVIVISYYSMFYIANAVLYSIGYKVGHKIAHKVTTDALLTFAKHRINDSLLQAYDLAQEEALSLTDSQLEHFEFERSKRSMVQYETTEEIKRSKAETSLKRAKEFSAHLEIVLQNLR
jgi:uncharacterized protein (UPF0332 family)